MNKITLILFLILSNTLQSQIVTTSNAPYNSVSYLTNNVLMGQGMQGYNISTYGATTQKGFFSGGLSSIGLDSGIVLSTGNVTNIMTSTGQVASTSIPNATGQGAGDADLLSVAQSVPSLIGQSFSVSSTWDAAIIEFDFIPQSDTVTFRYVFGSDEYLTWINTGYNDVFGFFLSGPGINGPYSNNAINVATIPNTNPTLPITISTIHPNLNGQYYNYGGNSLIALNGYTDIMTAILPVNACDTYHIKLAIADGSDKILDSSVFLEAASFEAIGIIVQPEPSYNPYGNDTAVYEGCGDVKIYFTRNDSILNADTLYYSIWGVAQMGVDYSNISNCAWNSNQNMWDCQLIFGQGVSIDSISYIPFYDNLNESIEDLVIAINDSNVALSCHSGDTIIMNILDQPDLIISPYGSTTLDCNDSMALIGVNVIQGLPPYTYTWSNNSQDSSQYVMPSTTTSYVVTVENSCGQQIETEVVTVSIFNVPWSVINIGNNQTISCIDPPVTIGVGVQFNDGIWHGDISYQWSTGETDSMISVFSYVDTSYVVTITRNCTGEQVIKTLNLYTQNIPVTTFTKDIIDSTIECPGDLVNIGVDVIGGYPPYSYQWDNGYTIDSFLVNPTTTTTYYVTVNDVCGLVDYIDSIVVNVPISSPLKILGISNDTVMCKNMKVHFGPAVPYGGFGWGYEFSWDNWQTKSNYLQDIIFEKDSFTIQLTDGCKFDTASITVYGIIAKKSSLTLDLNDTLICQGETLKLSPKVTGGGGRYEYYWSNASTDSVLIDMPKYSTEYELRLVDFCDSIRTKKVNVKVSSIIPLFDYTYVSDYEVKFDASPSVSTDSIILYEWFVDSGLITFGKTPTISFENGEAQEILLRVTDTNNCSNTYSNIIKPDFYLYIPNTFTPNLDNINDYWEIKGLGIKEISIEVFNRWGESIFKTNDKTFKWDGYYLGYKVPYGTYTFKVSLFTDTNEYYETTGTLNIIDTQY